MFSKISNSQRRYSSSHPVDCSFSVQPVGRKTISHSFSQTLVTQQMFKAQMLLHTPSALVILSPIEYTYVISNCDYFPKWYQVVVVNDIQSLNRNREQRCYCCRNFSRICRGLQCKRQHGITKSPILSSSSLWNLPSHATQQYGKQLINNTTQPNNQLSDFVKIYSLFQRC